MQRNMDVVSLDTPDLLLIIYSPLFSTLWQNTPSSHPVTRFEVRYLLIISRLHDFQLAISQTPQSLNLKC